MSSGSRWLTTLRKYLAELFESQRRHQRCRQIFIHVFWLAHPHQRASDSRGRSHKLDGSLRVRFEIRKSGLDLGGNAARKLALQKACAGKDREPASSRHLQSGHSRTIEWLGGCQQRFRHGEAMRKLDGAKMMILPAHIFSRAENILERHRFARSLSHSISIPRGGSIAADFSLRSGFLKRGKSRFETTIKFLAGDFAQLSLWIMDV